MKIIYIHNIMDFILDNQLLEKRQNITFHIKNLPSELINYIFSYVSLVPFDKKGFIMYITNCKAYYTNTEIYDLLAFDRIAFDKNDWYLNNTPYLYGHYIGRTRIHEDIWIISFSLSMNQKQRKKSTIHIQRK